MNENCCYLHSFVIDECSHLGVIAKAGPSQVGAQKQLMSIQLALNESWGLLSGSQLIVSFPLSHIIFLIIIWDA